MRDKGMSSPSSIFCHRANSAGVSHYCSDRKEGKSPFLGCGRLRKFCCLHKWPFMAVATGSVTLTGYSVPLGTVNIPWTIIPPKHNTMHNSQTADTMGSCCWKAKLKKSKFSPLCTQSATFFFTLSLFIVFYQLLSHIS